MTPARRAQARLSFIAHSLASLDCPLFTFTTLASPFTSLRFVHGALRAFVIFYPYNYSGITTNSRTLTITSLTLTSNIPTFN